MSTQTTATLISAEQSTAINAKAAAWWAKDFLLADKREPFKEALLRLLPHDDWYLDNDYSPTGTLSAAVEEVQPEPWQHPDWMSLFSRKTSMKREGDKLLLKPGYGAHWEPLDYTEKA
jgi:hypothetical protein